MTESVSEDPIVVDPPTQSWIRFLRQTSSPMIAPKRDCSRAKLQQLLADQLDEKVTTHVTQHVEDCETCRRDLEMLAAEASWWQDARRFLADEESGRAEDTMHDSTSCWRHETRDETFVSPDLIVEYLESADDPRVLGRLDQYAKEFQMGKLRSVTLTIDQGTLQVYHPGVIYYVALANSQGQLPLEKLNFIASELNRRGKS